MDDREAITEHGLFWRQDNGQRKLWGTLRINKINEATLETFGSLIDNEGRPPSNIIGQIKGGFDWVTLINCFPINTQHSFPVRDGEIDWSHQTCFVNQAVEGIAFEEGKEVAFEEATLDISTLSKWVNPNLVELDLTGGSTRPYRINVSIKDRADETAILNFKGEEIRVSIRFIPKGGSHRRGVISKYSVEDHCLLAIERSDGSRMPLESILSVTGAILDLLSICCNETPGVNDFHVRYEKENRFPAKVFVRMRGYNAEKKEGFPYPAPDFDDIGGAKGIAKWLEVSEKYGPTVGLLTSNWFNDKAYNEDRFARMYTAVEGLVSRKKARNRAKMKSTELAEFVEEAVPGFSALTNCPADDWAERVKEIRDQRISHSDPSSTLAPNGRAIIMMTNLLFVAGASFLLREIGMENQHIEKYVQVCYQSMLLSDQQ